MIILPPSGLPGVGDTKSEPGAGSVPLSYKGTAGNAAQSSFPAVLAQANQQGASPKAESAVKDSPGNATPLTLTQGEGQGGGSESTEGVSLVLSPVSLQEVVSAQAIQSSGNVVDLASNPNAQSQRIGNASQSILASDTSQLVAAEARTLGTPGGTSLPPSTGAPALQGEVDADISQISPVGHKSGNGQNLELAIQSKANDQRVVPPLTNEPLASVQPGNRPAVPSVPVSFVSPVFAQGQPPVDSVNTSKLSPTITQNAQGTLSVSTGSSGVTVIDGTGNSPLAVGGSEGHLDTGGSSLGSDQRGSQENGTSFANKQQASGHALGGFSLNTELGNDLRVSESQTSARTEMLTDRARAMTMSSPQRMQMEVMLADETKVQIEVAVKQQQVTAQLLTDQMMLRNLALQNEPQLEAQLSSVGLDLQQFGAEVSEEGLFGQHLSDSSSRNSYHGDRDESAHELESEMLVGAGAGDDGRLHFVA